MDVFPKFIIETDAELGDCLIMSKCTYHKQLATDLTKVKGGGWFIYEDDKITFHGSSYDLGVAKLGDIKKCIENDRVFRTPTLKHSIAKTYKFFYNIGSERIPLN